MTDPAGPCSAPPSYYCNRCNTRHLHSKLPVYPPHVARVLEAARSYKAAHSAVVKVGDDKAIKECWAACAEYLNAARGLPDE